MEQTSDKMDKSLIEAAGTFRAESFRVPVEAERRLGLWVDRVGRGVERNPPGLFRILGLFGAVLVERGRGHFHSAHGGGREVSEGDTMLLFPEEPSRYYPDGQWSLRWVLWDGPDARGLLELGCFGLERPVVAGAGDCVVRAGAALESLIARESLEDMLERKHVLLGLCLGLRRAAVGGGEGGGRNRLVERAVARIQVDEAANISVEELAAKAKLSVSRFRQVFKDAAGRGPKDYIVAFKMSRAKKHLSAGMSVKEAAAALGYDDPYYFARLFRRVTGVPPGLFRRQRGV